jgi:hypothetical protein
MTPTQPAYAPDDIERAAAQVARDFPRLAPGHYVTGDAWRALRDLAEMCGMTRIDAERATDADLISVYRVAAKSAGAAKRTAQTIVRRLNPGAQVVPFAAPSASHDPEALAALTADLAAVKRAHDTLMASVAADLAQARADADALADARLADAVAEAVKRAAPTVVSIAREPSAPLVSLGLTHKKTPAVLRALARGQHVYLHGPAGSGKTTVGKQAAKAFGLEFYMVAKVADQYELMGFKSLDGTVTKTELRKAVEFGGVLLFDELDKSGVGAASAMNSILANGYGAFPDGVVYCHPDFKCIAAGNTTLRGADPLYSDSEQMDASVIDRFGFVEFGYDEALEDALSINPDWLARVRQVRANVAARGLDILVTPRATIEGQKMLAAGETWEDTEEMWLWKGLDAATVAQISGVR